MNGKKALCLASMASNLDNFNRGNVEILQKLGYEVTLAANFSTDEDVNSAEKTAAFIEEMKACGVRTVQIDFSRRISKIGKHIRSYRQVKKLLGEGFGLIHCHTPIGSAIARFCARKEQKQGKVKVVYTAHGFHFYDGAPLLNWLIFYPIERYLSKYTDVQITINKEDYIRAVSRFKAVKTIYIPGIGIDVVSLKQRGGTEALKAAKRKELGVPSDAKLLISVGELSDRKNHMPVIEALNELNDPDVYYALVGMGTLREKLEQADRTGRVLFLGYRKDVPELIGASDLFVFPSLQEGLPVALMEAMAVGVPCVCSRIRGNTDLISDESCLFDPGSVTGIRKSLETDKSRSEADKAAETQKNEEKIRGFDKKIIQAKMEDLYQELTEEK
jgi:glycosyltransferase involved in cell wall biosynthesis